MDLTLFEIQLPEAQFNAPYSGRGVTDDDTSATGVDADDSGGPPVAPIAALLVVVGLALLARYLRSSDEPAEEPLEEAADEPEF